MDAIKVCDLFDLTHTRAAKMLAACEYPWEALSKIGETVLAIGQGLDLSDYDHPAEDVWIAKTATVAATAVVSARPSRAPRARRPRSRPRAARPRARSARNARPRLSKCLFPMNESLHKPLRSSHYAACTQHR